MIDGAYARAPIARPARAQAWPRVTLALRRAVPSMLPFRMPFWAAQAAMAARSAGMLEASLKRDRMVVSSTAGEPAATYRAFNTSPRVAALLPVLRNGNYRVINDYKFMPGASMTVRSGAVLEVAPATILVFYDQFEDVENNDSTEYPSDRGPAVLTVEQNGKLVNNKKLTIVSRDIYLSQ